MRRQTAAGNHPAKSRNSFTTALETRIFEAGPRLGRQRQKLVREILENCEETCFLSSRELAKRFQVDAATIVRTVQALGYKGFADFTNDLRQYFLQRNTAYTALKAATREKRSVHDHIDHTLDKAIDNLNILRTDLDRDQVIEIAKQIHRSRTILVAAADLASSLAYHLAYGLNSLGFNAEAPGGSEGHLQHKVKILTKKDLLIAISFGQCLRVTVEALIRARKQNVPTFGITDNHSTPIARHSASHLVVPVVSSSFINSYAGPMVLLNAILVACAHVNPKRSLIQLKQTNKDYLSGPRWFRESKNTTSE